MLVYASVGYGGEKQHLKGSGDQIRILTPGTGVTERRAIEIRLIILKNSSKNSSSTKPKKLLMIFASVKTF